MSLHFVKKDIVKALTGKMTGNERISILIGIITRNNRREVGSMIDNLAKKYLTNWQLKHFPDDFYKWVNE
jgi:hypothetical protein